MSAKLPPALQQAALSVFSDQESSPEEKLVALRSALGLPEGDSTGPRRVILPRDVEWEMDWSGTDAEGQRRYPDKPLREKVFQRAGALAHMLLNEALFLNSHHWQKEWPVEARKATALLVICNDVFAWGCADAEEMPLESIELVYRMYTKDPAWGTALWCILQRGQMPQDPVEQRIRATGLWDLDALQQRYGLLPNHYSGVSGMLARRKHKVYAEWCAAQGKEPLPYAAGWWAGWKEYTTANPQWNSPEWQQGDTDARAAWRAEAGYADDSESSGAEREFSELLEQLRNEQCAGMPVDCE